MDTTSDYVLVEWLCSVEYKVTRCQRYYVSRAFRFDKFVGSSMSARWAPFAKIKTTDDLVVRLKRRAIYQDVKTIWDFLDDFVARGGVTNQSNLIYRTTMSIGGGIDKVDEAMLGGVCVSFRSKIVHTVTGSVETHTNGCLIRDGSCDCDCKRLIAAAHHKMKMTFENQSQVVANHVKMSVKMSVTTGYVSTTTAS